jgi:hypothetical protein
VGSCETPTQVESKSAIPSSTDPWVSLSDCMGKEEVTYRIGQDRANAAAHKGKAKEGYVFKVSLPPQWVA